MRFLENAQIVPAFRPVDLQTAANDGDWVSMKNFHHLVAWFHSAIGTDGDDPTITLEQATNNAGGGAKALAFTDIYVKQAATNLLAVGQFTKTVQASAATYTDTDAAEEEALWAVEFDSDELDVDGGFDHVRIRVANVGGNAQLGAAYYLLTEPRFHQEPMPSAL